MSRRTFNSLVSVTTDIDLEDSNNQLFMQSLATLDPSLWRIKSYLLQYKINAEILPAIIEQLWRVDSGSGYGKVTIEIKEHRAVRCEGTDSKLLNLDLSE